MKGVDPATQRALAEAWHPASAESSLERWLQVRAQEGWGNVPHNLGLLARVFGTSWYFTRFIFYRGLDAVACLDAPAGSPPDSGGRRVRNQEEPLEAALENLCIRKNTCMLQVLLQALRGELPLEQEERVLSALAARIIGDILDIFGLNAWQEGWRLAVLGMGRLAGEEMTWGSDLDLIFLFEAEGNDDAVELSRRVHRLLRHISASSPAGILYEVDMRLRPHGTAGTLITTSASFVDYHAAQRATWERQMLTRCRVVHDPAGVGRAALARVHENVYASRDPGDLRRDIRDMRLRVERELGSPRGKCELKRGRGGIMDVDFLCHQLQLEHGHHVAALRSCSTRQVLRAAAEAGLLGRDACTELLRDYDFLRRVERALRLFDLKNISAFADRPENLLPLARATGHGDSTARFMDGYREARQRIRARFDQVTGS